jgi:hypothetical protein
MPPTLILLLAGLALLALVITVIVIAAKAVWTWGLRDDGEHSPRICSTIQQTRHGPLRCMHLAIPGEEYCRQHLGE